MISNGAVRASDVPAFIGPSTLFGIVAITSVAVAAASYRFVFLGFDGAFGDAGAFAAHLAVHPALFIAHVAAAPEQSKLNVLINGRCQGSTVSIPAKSSIWAFVES